MSKREPQESECRYCGQSFQRTNPIGRRQEYCSLRCRRRAQRERGKGGGTRLPAAKPLPLGRNIAEDLQLLVARLLTAEYEGQSLRVRLSLAGEVSREVEYYMSAVVHEEHMHKVSWEQLAAAASVSTATARARWAPKEVERRLARRATERSVARQQEVVLSATRAPLDHKALAEATSRAGSKLAAALSYLHRKSGLTVKEAASRVGSGLSAPYVSRILTGERLPTWEVTRQLVLACGGDPSEVSMLWEHAQGMAPPVRHPLPDAVKRLHAALRGLHLAAAHPSGERICEAGDGLLTPAVVAAVLDGHEVPTWPVTGAFVKALGGWPADIRPLWEAVEYGFLVRLHPESAADATPPTPPPPTRGPDASPGDRPDLPEPR
ncbi:helix-turn-helix domain-containing protein [Streptomyces sp. NPDC016845]|uniref:helix-turn-helix domain-containing protein n=1 Tax=Streptomyces sp. NPDC016845 TaxID=3364972 RepID=UPI0037ABEC2D